MEGTIIVGKRLYRMIRALLLVAFFAIAFCLGGTPNDGLAAKGVAQPPDVVIPYVVPRPLPTDVLLNRVPGKLPDGARGFFPAFDGDAFFFSIPPTMQIEALRADKVFGTVIIPILQAIGFENPEDPTKFVVPQTAGMPLPRANLAGLASDTCLELDGIDGIPPQYREICEVMQGKSDVTAQVQTVFKNGEGMDFDQFRADIERERIQYAFLQQYEGTPIEHTGIIASRWKEETITTVHGAVFNQFDVVKPMNHIRLTPEEAAERALEKLKKVPGVAGVQNQAPETNDIELFLLPDGTTSPPPPSIRLPALRYAYRMPILGAIEVTGTSPESASWLLWLDAYTGEILQLVPQFGFTAAQGKRWRRDPSTDVEIVGFAVDPAAEGGKYQLKLDRVFNRIDRLGDDDEVEIADDNHGSSTTFANFDQDPINNADKALCQSGNSGGNNLFRQVNVYAHLYRFWHLIANAGTTPRFPIAAITVQVDVKANRNSYDYGNGQSTLKFKKGSGFDGIDCPCSGELNSALDATVIAHEFAHLSTLRLQEQRPKDWCGSDHCFTRIKAHKAFHDFADAFAQAYASTNCFSGWTNKNEGGNNCAGNTSETGGLPRRARASEVLVPSTPGEEEDDIDHFPEHRHDFEDPSDYLGYSDGQIAAAALWEVRKGMRSKCLPSGTPQYLVRLTRALWNFGFFPGPSCEGGTGGRCDLDIYRYLQDLFRHLVDQWATSGQPGGPLAFRHNGAHTTNKVLSAFARVGIFLVPFNCIDEDDGSNNDPCYCPEGSNGGNPINGGVAVIDINDNDRSDDLVIDGVTHPEVDYLEASGEPPIFQVWTGPRFRFKETGKADTDMPCPCNAKFQVEVANNPKFADNPPKMVRFTSTVQKVSTDPKSPESCYREWMLDWDSWNVLKTHDRIYYRVRTWKDATGSNERESTELMAGPNGCNRLTVPPPYAIINP